MLRPLYTRYRLVGGTLQLCRWRWVSADYPKCGRVTFPEFPGLEWEIVADYQREARSPGALPLEPDLWIRAPKGAGRRQVDDVTAVRLKDAFERSMSVQSASRYAGCSQVTVRRHFTRMQQALSAYGQATTAGARAS